MEDQLAFDVILHCIKTGLSSHKQIHFTCGPTLVQDIKIAVETQHSIPLCTQTLAYDSQVLRDDSRLSSIGARVGDTFHITYLSEGDCEEIIDIISWMGLILAAFGHENPSVSTGISAMFDDLLTNGIQLELIEDLAFKYFFPWLDERKYVNKLHFVYNGGIDIIMEVYAAILKQPWEHTIIKLKYMEYGILRVLWNLSETFSLRRVITRHGGLQMCMQSLLRTKLIEGERIEDPVSPDQQAPNWILVETIGAALGTLCNLSELPECHMEIAHNEDVLDQLTCISLTPSVRIMSAQLVATLFLCMAYTPKTHYYISQPDFIRRLLRACEMNRVFGSDEDKQLDTLMLRYFTQIFLAQVAVVSPQHIPLEYCEQICDTMQAFLQSTPYETVKEGEIKHWYVWSTFLPYVKLLYTPHCPLPSDGLMRRLQLLSLEMILFGLRNMLSRENHRTVLMKEGLIDYITCCPTHVPEILQPQAKELVSMVTSSPDVRPQPAKLTNIVKAYLAKVHFGLEQILSMSVSEIVTALVSQQSSQVLFL